MSRIKWDRTVIDRPGAPDAVAVLKYKLLATLGSWVLRLHKIMVADPPGQFHGHPARYQIRVILWGGYVEEMLDGRRRRWFPGRIGLVRDTDVHRIDRLLNGPSYSLWFRSPTSGKTLLTGWGWPPEKRDTWV
jgi:hypothetical protein